MHKELAVAIFASLIVLFLGCRSPERDKSEQRAQGSSDIQRSEKQSSPSSSGSSSGSGRIQDQDGEGQTPGTIIVLCPHFYIAHSEHLLSIFTRVYRLVYSHDAPLYRNAGIYHTRKIPPTRKISYQGRTTMLFYHNRCNGSKELWIERLRRRQCKDH